MKKIYLKTLLTFVLSLLFGVQGWADSSGLVAIKTTTLTMGAHSDTQIPADKFSQNAVTAKLSIEPVNYATITSGSNTIWTRDWSNKTSLSYDITDESTMALAKEGKLSIRLGWNEDGTVTVTITSYGAESDIENGGGEGGGGTGGGSDNTPTNTGLTDLGENGLYSYGEHAYSYTGTATTLVEGATINAIGTTTNIQYYLNSNGSGGEWFQERTATFTLTTDDVTKLAQTNYTFWMAAWSGTITKVTITLPDGTVVGEGGNTGGGTTDPEGGEGGGETPTPDDDPEADYSHQNDANGDGVLEPTAETPAFGVKVNYHRYPQKTDVPTIYITTDAGQDVSNLYTTKTETYYTANIVVVDKNGKMKQRNEAVTFRGRGNSTWNSGSKKKPWRLKFPSKTKFLAEYDLSAGAEINNYANAKSWTLLSNVYDKTLMRNALTAELGKRAGLEFNPAYRFVDLVINGQYLGTYQVSDQVQVDSKRVNVDSKTGWFLEHSTNNFAEDPYIMPKAGSANLYVTVKNPETETVTASGESKEAEEGGAYYEMKQWLTQYWSSLVNASYSSEADKYKAWRDQTNLKSVIGWMIVEDLAGNYDGGMANVYAYKEAASNKLKFGPLWDLDIAYGNYNTLEGTHFWSAQTQGVGSLFGEMFKDKYFVKALYEKWTEFKDGDGLKNFINSKVSEISTLLAQTQAANYNTTGDSFRNGDAGWTLSSNVSWCTKGVSSYNEAKSAITSYLLDTTNGRIAWIEKEYKKQYDALGCASLPATDWSVDDEEIEDPSDDTGNTGGDTSNMTLAEKIEAKTQITNIPTIYLTVPDVGEAKTTGDISNVLKKTGDNDLDYHAATIKVVDLSGKLENFTDDKLQIKVRGNSTAEDSKRPFRLKFAKDEKDEATGALIASHKHDLLGAGYKKRNWTLLSNHKDASLLHNAMTYYVGKDVGLPFCPGYQFVDLVINGVYFGNYQISDHVEVGKNRVDVDEDTGWFIEVSKNTMVEEPTVNAAGLYMTIKSPEYDPTTEADKISTLKTEVESYFKRLHYFWGINSTPCSLEEFCNPKTGWRAYMDEESLVDFYIGINLTDDYDGFMTVKMYREVDGKLKFGPLWDKDLAYGNWQNHGKLAEEYQTGYTFSDHIQRMMEDPYFVKKVHDKLHEIVDAGFIANMKKKIQDTGKLITASQALNQNVWWTCSDYPAAVTEFANYIEEHTNYVVGRIDAKYNAIDWSTVPTYPDTPDDDGDNTPVGDLGALVDLGNGKYSYTGSASTFKEGTEITITTSEGTTLSNYITEGNEWNTTKTITLTADDVTTLAANSYTFFMNATGGEVKAVNVKVPSSSAGAEFNKEYISSYNSGDFVVPASNFNANATSIKVVLKNNLSNYNDGWNGNYGFNGHPWKAAYPWTTTNTCEIIVTDAEDIQSVAQYGMGITGPKDLTVTVINYGTSQEENTPTYTLTLSASEGGTVSGAGTYAEGTTVLIKAIPNEGYKFVKWSDDNTYASRSVTLKEAITLTATFAAEGSADEDPFNEQGTRKQLTDLPTIYIDTNAAVGDSWGIATLDIYDSADKLYSTSWKSKSVYVQYQGSGAGGKDSYRLKFDKKTQMMDSGSFKQWVLLANDDDPTMLNNALAKVIGDAVDMPYTPGCQFVDLYVNNTYMGTYQLTDRVKAEPDRSLVADGNNNDDWQVRFNDNGELAEDNPATTDYIAGTTTMPNIIIKNPDPDDYHTAGNETGLAALKSTMSDYFTTVFATDENGNYTNIADMVNTDQLVAWYIAQEILGVYKGFSSIEAYRSVTSLTDQKLHIGPLWDSEKGFGNTGEVTAPDNTTDLDNDASHNGLMISWSAYPMMNNLFTNLWTQPWFKTAVKTKWEEISGTLPASLSQTIETLSGTIAESQALNAKKWSNSLGSYSSYKDALAATKAYITARFAYLDKKFAVLAEGACEHTYTSNLFADNGDGTHSPKCDKCDYVNTEVKTNHSYTAKDNHPYCDICKATETATIEGTVANNTKVYRIHEAVTTTDIKYVTAESNFASSGNKIYICNEEITGEANNLTNVVWPRSADTDYNGNEIVFVDGDYTYDENEKMHVKSASYTRNMTSTWGTLCLPFKVASCEDYTLYEIKDTKIGDDNKSGTIVFSEITEASGLQPVVFRKKTSAGSVTFRGVAQTEGVNNGLVTVKKSKKLGNTDAMVSTGVEGSGTWALYGNAKKNKTTAEISPDFSNVYYIASNKFWQGDAHVTVATFRAVFVFTPAPGNEATAKSFTISFDDNFTTDINSTVIDKNLAIFTGNGEIILNANYDTRVSIYNINGTAVTTTNIEKGVQKNISLPNGMYIINGTKVVVK